MEQDQSPEDCEKRYYFTMKSRLTAGIFYADKYTLTKVKSNHRKSYEYADCKTRTIKSL